MKTWATIEKALKEGCNLDIYSSASGVAIVALMRQGQRVAYGQFAGMYAAIKQASEDYEAGGRDPNDVYGPGKLYPNFITGAHADQDELERWIIGKGYDFEAIWDGRDIVITMTGHFDEIPNPHNLFRIRKIGRGETFVEALLAAWLCLPKPHSLRKTA